MLLLAYDVCNSTAAVNCTTIREYAPFVSLAEMCQGIGLLHHFSTSPVGRLLRGSPYKLRIHPV